MSKKSKGTCGCDRCERCTNLLAACMCKRCACCGKLEPMPVAPFDWYGRPITVTPWWQVFPQYTYTSVAIGGALGELAAISVPQSLTTTQTLLTCTAGES